MIDRAARAEVRDAIDAFLSDRITAREFDERVFDPGVDTDDRTVDAAAHCLWHFYDDFEDHKVCLDKVGWDAAQRIAVLLDSAVEAEWKTTRRWHVTQWLAAGMLLGLFGIGWFAGWWLAALAAICTGPLAAVLHAWRRDFADKMAPESSPIIWPYDSLGSLRYVRRRASGFRKRPYRRDISGRRIRSRFSETVQPAVEVLVFAVLSPFMYLAQCFPPSKQWLHVCRDDDELSSAA